MGDHPAQAHVAQAVEGGLAGKVRFAPDVLPSARSRPSAQAGAPKEDADMVRGAFLEHLA